MSILLIQGDPSVNAIWFFKLFHLVDTGTPPPPNWFWVWSEEMLMVDDMEVWVTHSFGLTWALWPYLCPIVDTASTPEQTAIGPTVILMWIIWQNFRWWWAVKFHRNVMSHSSPSGSFFFFSCQSGPQGIDIYFPTWACHKLHIHLSSHFIC